MKGRRVHYTALVPGREYLIGRRGYPVYLFDSSRPVQSGVFERQEGSRVVFTRRSMSHIWWGHQQGMLDVWFHYFYEVLE